MKTTRANPDPLLDNAARALYEARVPEDTRAAYDEIAELKRMLREEKAYLAKLETRYNRSLSQGTEVTPKVKRQVSKLEDEVTEQQDHVYGLETALQEAQAAVGVYNQDSPWYRRSNPMAEGTFDGKPYTVKDYDGMLQVNGDAQPYELSFQYGQRDQVGVYPNPSSAWQRHLMAFHKAHPGNDFSKNMKLAAKTYRKQARRNPEGDGEDQSKPMPFQNPRAMATPAYSLMANPSWNENKWTAIYGLGALVALTVAAKFIPRLRG